MYDNTTSPFISHNRLTWSLLTQPWFIILYLSSSLTNFVLFTTMLKDPLNCFRSMSSYLLFNLLLSGFSPMVTYCLCIITLVANTEYLAVWSSVFAFHHTILAVLLLSIDRYILVSRPLVYSVIITRSRCFYAIVLSWILCMALTYFVAVRLIHIATKVFVFALISFILLMVLVVIVVDVITWRSILNAQSELRRFGNETRLDRTSTNFRAEHRRLQTEKRFAKVVIILLLNVIFFIFPQSVVVAGRALCALCKSCVNCSMLQKAHSFQLYFFPLFYLTTPVLYLVGIPKYRKSLALLFRCIFRVSRRSEITR